MKTALKILVLIGLLGGAYAAWHYKPWAKEDPLKTEATVRVTKGNIEDVVTAQGKLEPKEYVDVGAQVSGQLEKLYVELGDSVKTGDLLAEIDAELYVTKVQGEEANLKTLKAQKAEQEAKVAQAKQKVSRNKKLFDVQALSQEAYQDTQTDLKVAQAQLNSIAAQIEQAEYSLEGNKTNLNYTKIYAPMSGTVVSQSAREGQTLNANQTTPTIVQLGDLDTMTVKAQVAEADIVRIKPDMEVYFTILGSQQRKWTAKVRQILPTPETINDVVLYNVMVDVDNKDRQLMSGMSTQMFFVSGSAENVLTVPSSVLKARKTDQDTETGKAYEVTVVKGHVREKRTIMVGLQDRTTGEVISGVQEGETILVPSLAPASPTAAGQGKGMRGMARL